MPTRSKSARLWLRSEKRSHGKLVRRSHWIILDHGRQIATGCLAPEIEAAEQKLAEYVAAKYHPTRKERDIELIDIADVLSIYYEDTVRRQARPSQLAARLSRLNEFWGALKLSDVNGETCRAEWRGNEGGSRRDLEDLRAAIQHHAKEGLHRGVVRVTLPGKGSPRTMWLTRNDVARLLWTCWRYREVQTVHRGIEKGRRRATERYPLRHIARFMLFSVYTGTRSGAVLTASFQRGEGRSFIDLSSGLFHRLAEGSRETNKRQPTVPLPPRLLAHLRRWVRRRVCREFLVEWHGRPVLSVKTGFGSALRVAGLKGKITPPHPAPHGSDLAHAGRCR
jgi:hypothetical protein